MIREISEPAIAAASQIEHRLGKYALAAAAASVGVLALAEPAQAKVVITVKNIPIPLCGVDVCPVSVDLNHDGIADFSFTVGTFAYHENSLGRVHIRGLTPGAEAVGTPAGYFRDYASDLVRGAKIGPSAHFASSTRSGGITIEGSNQCFRYCDGKYGRYFYGKWGGNHPNRFLGVTFQIKGVTHYGWVRITVTTNASQRLSAEITEYGYETIANKVVLAGEKSNTAEAFQAQNVPVQRESSLGMLAQGADGLAMWRRENHEALTN
jgi:hypothetical protein